MLKNIERGMNADHLPREDLERCRQVMLSGLIPGDEEIITISNLFRVRLMITYGSSVPIQAVGHASWPGAVLSNEPVTDGEGKAMPHFRYIWLDADDEDPKNSLDNATLGRWTARTHTA